MIKMRNDCASERAGVGMIVLGLNGGIMHTNPAFDRFIGCDEKELIGDGNELDERVNLPSEPEWKSLKVPEDTVPGERVP